MCMYECAIHIPAYHKMIYIHSRHDSGGHFSQFSTGCFNKMYSIEMLNFEKQRALISLCVTPHIPNTSYDDFRCIEAELEQFF